MTNEQKGGRRLLAAALTLALLATIGCGGPADSAADRRARSGIAGNSQVEADPVNTNRIELFYVCGNEFNVRNANPLSLLVRWKVQNSSDEGTVVLPAASGGAKGQTNFVTNAVGTVYLYYGNTNIRRYANQQKPCASPPPPPPPPPPAPPPPADCSLSDGERHGPVVGGAQPPLGRHAQHGDARRAPAALEHHGGRGRVGLPEQRLHGCAGTVAALLRHADPTAGWAHPGCGRPHQQRPRSARREPLRTLDDEVDARHPDARGPLVPERAEHARRRGAGHRGRDRNGRAEPHSRNATHRRQLV